MSANASRWMALVAGEASGDVLAAQLLQGLRAHWPGLRAAGIGGPALQAQGFEAWWPSERLAVRGYVEVLRHYRAIVAMRRALKQRLLQERPALFVGVDAPDFNLPLEADLRAAGVRTVHFVAPAIWAWRPERVELIRRACDHVLCIFPFEPALLAEHGIAATYVGHPLASVIPAQPDQAAARQALGVPMDAAVVALLPGSRRAEIDHLLPRMLAAAQRMRQQRPALRFVLPAVPALRSVILQHLQRAAASAWVKVLDGQSHTALAACDVTLVASGTATLEAALFKRPMVIAYHMHPLSWWITRRKMRQPWVGLPNILCRDFVVPELLQDAATPAALAQATLAWLADDAATQARRRALQQRFAALHDELRRDTVGAALQVLRPMLEGAT
ncbi:lipid-A-disaccharide synthase [Tepidimonas ignava]|uniref:Lipid-A-disaccharide synthase n=1 Tax=Tepidimonas ignava TaxID=114249 RepID=A0A4R3LH82_9BURK|nr:lipid-A-disaccharide synthase [Tepidimonas ignava]TCS99412.1 lipid-A-disaccharide synthase [Tepidimonas ignava]TSE24239.1 Lipid-A-disaccharide synthase [Tepidimonas ignava]